MFNASVIAAHLVRAVVNQKDSLIRRLKMSENMLRMLLSWQYSVNQMLWSSLLSNVVGFSGINSSMPSVSAAAWKPELFLQEAHSRFAEQNAAIIRLITTVGHLVSRLESQASLPNELVIHCGTCQVTPTTAGNLKKQWMKRRHFSAAPHDKVLALPAPEVPGSQRIPKSRPIAPIPRIFKEASVVLALPAPKGNSAHQAKHPQRGDTGGPQEKTRFIVKRRAVAPPQSKDTPARALHVPLLSATKAQTPIAPYARDHRAPPSVGAGGAAVEPLMRIHGFGLGAPRTSRGGAALGASKDICPARTNTLSEDMTGQKGYAVSWNRPLVGALASDDRCSRSILHRRLCRQSTARLGQLEAGTAEPAAVTSETKDNTIVDNAFKGRLHTHKGGMALALARAWQRGRTLPRVALEAEQTSGGAVIKKTPVNETFEPTSAGASPRVQSQAGKAPDANKSMCGSSGRRMLLRARAN